MEQTGGLFIIHKKLLHEKSRVMNKFKQTRPDSQVLTWKTSCLLFMWKGNSCIRDVIRTKSQKCANEGEEIHFLREEKARLAYLLFQIFYITENTPYAGLQMD